MTNDNSKSWQFNRQINVSTLVQLVLLACLIIGSYVNLQRQLDLLQRDVTMLLQCQKDFSRKVEDLSATSISYEYRLRAVERDLGNVPPSYRPGIVTSSPICVRARGLRGVST